MIRTLSKGFMLALLLNSAYAQQNFKDELRIGDTFPDILIPKLKTVGASHLSTEDFENKLIIFDFWTTHCSECIEIMPKMDSLQKVFGNKIMIMPVTYEKEGIVRDFWKTNKVLRTLPFKSIVDDKILNSLFRNRSVPHEVWIYKGKVVAITLDEYVDGDGIRKVLTGQDVKFPVKNDYYFYDKSKPLFALNPLQIDTGKSGTLTYAAISDYRDSINSTSLSGGIGVTRNSASKSVRTYFLNQPILLSYMLFYRLSGKLNTLKIPKGSYNNQVVWEVKDKKRYRYDSSYGHLRDWMQKYAVCFESLHLESGKNDSQLYESAITDLNRLFGLNVRWERRMTKVYVCRKLENFAPIKNGSTGDTYFISSLVNNLNRYEDNPYVFDETKDDQARINIDVKSWTDLSTIKAALLRGGFSLIEENREVDKLVFSEIDGGYFVDKIN